MKTRSKAPTLSKPVFPWQEVGGRSETPICWTRHPSIRKVIGHSFFEDIYTQHHTPQWHYLVIYASLITSDTKGQSSLKLQLTMMDADPLAKAAKPKMDADPFKLVPEHLVGPRVT